MSKLQLFLETSDSELFRKATCELGTIFFRQSKADPAYWEIVYFSGSRVARFEGTPSNDVIRLCEASGFEVENIDLDMNLGTLRVQQKNGGEKCE